MKWGEQELNEDHQWATNVSVCVTHEEKEQSSMTDDNGEGAGRGTLI